MGFLETEHLDGASLEESLGSGTSEIVVPENLGPSIVTDAPKSIENVVYQGRGGFLDFYETTIIDDSAPIAKPEKPIVHVANINDFTTGMLIDFEEAKRKLREEEIKRVSNQNSPFLGRSWGLIRQAALVLATSFIK